MVSDLYYFKIEVFTMSSEIDNLVNEIKQSMALLRRHL